MTYNKKPSHKKLYLAIALIVILVAASAAAVYFATLPKPIKVGVKAGDTFTYHIQGISVLGVNVTNPDTDFARYNNTEYFRVTVTSVKNNTVGLATEWKFKNGTVVNDNQEINVASGEKSNEYGYWAVYPSNLAVGDLLRPQGFDGKTVNATDTSTYSSGTRQKNYFYVEGEFSDMTDETQSTYRYDYVGVNFDQETGMMVTMQNWQEYNNPQYRLVILYTLTNTTAWAF
ncbi:MAG: hypothetical protein NWE93_14285 [Candidatus Bathyarchaeota archaeon]|nr:hypothetical protein [Candidatus Bathyarchaeota archaeon]